MKLDPENRWVKKAATIPWDAIEIKYAALFKNRNGNVAKPLRMALGSLLIQTQYHLADGIYRTRENLAFCKSKGIRLSGKPLGRPKADNRMDKKVMRKDEIDRVGVEREFSYAKGSFGLGQIRSKLKDTSKTAIALSILALNIAHIGRILREFLTFWNVAPFLRRIFNIRWKLAVVQ